ncbi:MAG: archease [Pirellulales bacterium]|nr:archease [Pirellulales bacterium]
MYEIFEHTADVGIRARAGDLNGLFADAAKGLFSLILANPDSVRPVQETHIRIDGDQYDDLLFDWLAELLYRFDTDHLLPAEFEVRIDAAGLDATARGEQLDRSRHQLDREVKAITYHGLDVRRDADQWVAEVIVDI